MISSRLVLFFHQTEIVPHSFMHSSPHSTLSYLLRVRVQLLVLSPYFVLPLPQRATLQRTMIDPMLIHCSPIHQALTTCLAKSSALKTCGTLLNLLASPFRSSAHAKNIGLRPFPRPQRICPRDSRRINDCRTGACRRQV